MMMLMIDINNKPMYIKIYSLDREINDIPMFIDLYLDIYIYTHTQMSYETLLAALNIFNMRSR